MTDTKPSDVDGLIAALNDHAETADKHSLIHGARRMREAATTLAQLKTVLDREAATIARYDAKLDERAAELDRMKRAIEMVCINSNPDWTERRRDPVKALDDIHSLAVDAYYHRAALKEPS